MTEYLPEGYLIETAKNKNALSSVENLMEAQKNRTILEAFASVCTAKHDLIVELGPIRGIIPKNEGAIGIESIDYDKLYLHFVGDKAFYIYRSLLARF